MAAEGNATEEEMEKLNGDESVDSKAPDTKAPNSNTNQKPPEIETAVSGSNIELWEEYIPEPPDGGWGWVVMIASFFNNFILDGIAYSFGVFIEDYSQHFNASIGSTTLASSFLCGIYLMIGPIAGALVNKYGLRAVGITGSLIGASAFLLSILSPNIIVFTLLYGFIGGFGFGLMYLPAVVGVGYYFSKKRAIATGIAVCGTGIGTLCMAPIGKALLDAYSWKSAHIILAGIVLQGCISSSMMRPLTSRRKKIIPKSEYKESMQEKTTRSSAVVKSMSHLTPSMQNKVHTSSYFQSHIGIVTPEDLTRPMYRKDIFYTSSINVDTQPQSRRQSVDRLRGVASTISIPDSIQEASRFKCFNRLPKPMADILVEMLDITVLKHPGMMILNAANLVGMMGFYVPILFTAHRAEKLGIDSEKAALLLSIIGICNTCGRVLSGFLSTIPKVSPLLLNNICITLAGIATLLTPLCVSYPAMAFSAAAAGLFCSTFISLSPLLVADLVGIEKLTNGFGLLCLIRGISALVSPPLEGRLYDITGSYDATFYMGGICLLVSAFLHFMLHLPYCKGKHTQTNNKNLKEI